ncbi:MAG: sulfatase-like hydrolase/transferase [Planctomycetota bacterium]
MISLIASPWRHSAVTLTLVFSVCLTPAIARSEPASRPNVILILADDLGYGDVGYQGAPDVLTPNLDRLASQGMTFTQMRANCTVCSPTRAAIMTMRYADRVGVPGVIRTKPESSFGFLAPGIPTIADRLREGGYHTGIVGKWHLGLESPNTPNERGFDHFHGFLGDMMDDYYHHRRHGNNYMRLNDQVIEPKGHATDLFSQWAIDYVTERSKQPEQPFFLYLAFNAPHFPIQPPEDWLQRVRERAPELSEKRSKNVAFVEHLDDAVGRLMTQLDKLELTGNTIVAFTSDNGGSLAHAQRNLPWRDGKQSHYDGGLKVPCLFRYPGHVKAGGRSDYAGLTFDLSATFLEFAGLPPSAGSDAVGLKGILSGGPTPSPTKPRTLYFVRREGNARYVGHAYHALVRGKWKLMQNNPFEPLELYDLDTDPKETTDVIGQFPKVAAELKRALSAQIQKGGQVPWQPRP